MKVAATGNLGILDVTFTKWAITTISLSSETISAGANLQKTVSVTGVAEGTIVMCSPTGTWNAQFNYLIWSGFAKTDEIGIQLYNVHASSDYTAGGSFKCMYIEVS